MPTPPRSDEQCREVAETYLGLFRNGLPPKIKEVADALGLEWSTAKRTLADAASRGLLGTSPVLPSFRISKVSTVLDENGETVREFVQQRPEAGGPFNLPDGHRIKGISALLDGQGNVQSQWVKTRADEIDPMAEAEAIRSIFDGLTPAVAIPPPSYTDSDLLTVYPVSDAHIGMRAWSRETGEDYDTDIAVDRLRSWIGRLVSSSPQSKEAIILDVGDLTHMDDGTNQTPASKHILDVDGRYFRTMEMTISALADATELALAKHDHVQVVIIAGNHNPHSFMAILFALAERYRDNPRVTVRKDPREFWCHQFGDCLLAAHHGDKAKPERLVMFLADEYAQQWGATKHRYLWTGHLHHHRSADIGGVKWEQLRAMTSRDAYAFTHAYSARSQLQAITLHRMAGEIQRQAVSSYSA